MNKHHPVQKKDHHPFWFKGTMLLMGISILFIVLIYGKFILMPLAFAAFFSMLLAPAVTWFEKLNIGRILSIVCTMLAVLILLAGVISLVSVQFVQFAEEVPVATERLKNLLNQGIAFAEESLGISQEQQTDYLQQGLNNFIDQSGEYLTSLLNATTNAFTLATLIPIFMFFMLYYKEMYQTFLRKLFEQRNRAIDELTFRVQEVTQNYLIGMLTVIGFLAVLNTLGLVIIGLDHAIFFGVFAALIAIIPYIGTIIGGLLPTLYAFLFTDSLITPLLVVGVFAVTQFLEGNIITPRVVGSKVSINPFMALIALIIGGQIWGISGMILFVPFIGILKVIFEEVEDLKPYGYLLGNKVEYSAEQPAES